MKKIIFILIFFNYHLFSQEVGLDTNTIKIGDQATLQIKLKIDNINTINWPIFNDTIISGLEIIEKSQIDTVKNSDSITLIQSFIITSWDSGVYQIPAFHFNSNQKSSPLILNVQSIQVDTNGAIKDIKEPIDTEFELQDILIYIIIFFIILIIIYVLKKYVFAKRAKEIKLVKKEIEPSHIIALRELNNIKDSDLLNNGEIKIYHSKISEILRRYLENRYEFIALELPTADILNKIHEKDIHKNEITNLQRILERADLAKFAKNKPEDKENQESIDLAVLFVENTKIILENE